MNWAWQKNLKPTPKLILMALADAADNEGICWPSIPVVAAKCSVSDRTVQRAMRMFAVCRLIAADERFRPDGSRTSNRYRLLLKGGDKLSPPPDSVDTTSRQGCQGDPDTGVTPRTTTESKKESSLPQVAEVTSMAPMLTEGGSEKLLEYPKSLLPAERAQAARIIQVLSNPIVAQQVLDEWDGIIKAGAIRSSKLGCLRGLIRKAQEGTFTPERGLKITQVRQNRRRLEAAQEKAKVQLQQLVSTDRTNPLVRRIAAFSKRSEK